MKIFLCCLLLASGGAFAQAPASLADKVFRNRLVLSGVTNALEGTILLQADGRYQGLKTALGVIETLTTVGGRPEASWGAIQRPGTDGRFEYLRTSTTTGTLTFFPDGTEAGEPMQLRFTSSTTGTVSPSGLVGHTFYLTDLNAANAAPLANVSLRGRVTEGRPLIMGFVVPGSGERELLIRVIGPALASLGVSGAWATSSLQIYKGNRALFGDSFRFPFWSDVPTGIFPGASNTSPEAGLRRIFDYVGAFSLPAGSKDSAIVIRLASGNYTVVATAAAGDPGGEALIELYALP
ncbi:MAG TPA: hypothetical protein VM029_15095 [Opitutaceae bacterium]|nr:hypothetical protein [Opitutaceae bacterium]